MNRVLNATVQRTADHAAPEITLDPLEIVGGTHYFHFVHTFIVSHFIPPLLDICTHSFCVSGICSSSEIRWSENAYFSCLMWFTRSRVCCFPLHITCTGHLLTSSLYLWYLLFRWDQVIREHIFVPGCTPAVLRAVVPALRETGQWGRPDLCLQHPLHWRGSSWHKLEFLPHIFFCTDL